MEYLSQESQQMFDVMDRYETGEINLEQATEMIMAWAHTHVLQLRKHCTRQILIAHHT